MNVVSLQVGEMAPAFSAIAIGGTYGNGTSVSLEQFIGKTVILYFYPKDDTPGCTLQACGLRDAWSRFEGKAEIFGVSVDSGASHLKFIAKHSLPFPLLADEGRELVNSYGVWVEKSMYGRKFMGTERSTFVIAADGRLKAILRKVKPAGHVEELLVLL
ncbi:MAG: bcp [Chthoniobacteraceae bacterium]|nr:bcp [Chthoniobacteraceae bacterium]